MVMDDSTKCKDFPEVMEPTGEESVKKQAKQESKKKRNNRMFNIELTEKTPHAEVVFEVIKGVSVRATYNLSSVTGRYSRGTIGLIDPDTGRLMQIQKTDNKHDFKTALQMELIIPMPEKEGESIEEVVERRTKMRANELLDKYRPIVDMELKKGKQLEGISLGQAYELYAADYLADRTQSIQQRTVYQGRIKKLGVFLGEKATKSIRKKDLLAFCESHEGGNGMEFISEVYNFLSYVARRVGVQIPADTAFSSFFAEERKKEVENDAEKQQEKEKTIKVLPQEYEEKLISGYWENIGNAYWSAAAFLDDSGLNSKRVCTRKIGDLEFETYEGQEGAYVGFRRDDLSSYTHDYTFPLFPFGREYMRAYLVKLEELFGTERLDKDKYLFSEDEQGEIPLNPSDLVKFVSGDLSRWLFGKTGRVMIGPDAYISMGVDLLYETREEHLKMDCRFENDVGAINFLCHRALSTMVQSDSYRCFTDPTGRRYLNKTLSGFKRGCNAERKTNRRMSSVKRDRRVEYRFPCKSNARAGCDGELVLEIAGLKPGDKIEVFSKEGCYVYTTTGEE